MLKRTTVVLIVLAMSAAVCLAAPGDERDRKIQAMKMKIDVLRLKASKLKAAGEAEAAEECARRADQMQEELRAWAGGGEAREKPRLEKILHGLEMGVVALKELGRKEEAIRLNGIADEVRREMKGRQADDRERRAAREQIEVMRVAVHGFREFEKGEAAERLEQKIRAIELALEGRRDEEARGIRERAPGREETAKLLFAASGLWADLGHETKAAACEKLAHVFAPDARKWPERERRVGPEQAPLVHRLEVMHLAMEVLRDAGRRDLVEAMERAAHALKLEIVGREDPEAREIRAKAPGPEDQIEILMLAAKLWKEHGKLDKAEWCAKEANAIREGRKRERSPEPEAAELRERIDRLERMLGEISRELKELKGRR